MDYAFGKTRKQLKSIDSSREAFERVLKQREESIELKNVKIKADTDTLIGTKPGFKSLQKVKAVNTINKRTAEIFNDKLSNSFGLVVANAVKLDNENEEVKGKIVENVAKLFNNLLANEKVNVEAINLESAPHTVEYLANIMALAKNQAASELSDSKLSEEIDDSINDSIARYEEALSSVIENKIELMLKNEKAIKEKMEADELYARENAYDAEKYLKKKAKNYTSLFRDIMNAHVDAYIKSEKEVNKSKVMTESIITYAVLETLHTSKLASRADLTYIA